MTQFLLVQSAGCPVANGFGAKRVTDSPYLVRAARENFGELDTVWVVRPNEGEVDILVDNALEHIQSGGEYRETHLAQLLATIVGNAEGLALFWASYPNNLPIAAIPAEVHALVESDLRRTGKANPELYVRWLRA